MRPCQIAIPLAHRSAAALPNTRILCSLSQMSCGTAVTRPARAAPAPSATSTAGRTQQSRVAELASNAPAGVVEIVCGTLIIFGLLTRVAAVPLIIIMIVAIASTKIPILLGHDFWIFHVTKLPRYGFWTFLHEARSDFVMLLGSIYLLIEGGGAWSLDASIIRKLRTASPKGRE